MEINVWMEGHVGTESTHLHVTVWKDLQMENEKFARSVRILSEILTIRIQKNESTISTKFYYNSSFVQTHLKY